jgi:hypothetical protein
MECVEERRWNSSTSQLATGCKLGMAADAAHAGTHINFLDDGRTAPTVTASAATAGVDETPGVQTTGGASDVLGSTAITFNGGAITVAGLFSLRRGGQRLGRPGRDRRHQGDPAVPRTEGYRPSRA